MFFSNAVDRVDRIVIGVGFQHLENVLVTVCDHETMLEDWKKAGQFGGEANITTSTSSSTDWT